MKRISQSIHSFMEGRYGSDKLNLFLSVTAAILCLLSLIPHMQWLIVCAAIIYSWSVFRFLSRDIYSRHRECSQYFRIKRSITQWFRFQLQKRKDRKTHRYYRCPLCKVTVRVIKPRKRKRVLIHCPKCHNDFIKRI